MYKRIDIKVTFRCNNHCDFCAQGHKRDRVTDRPLERVYADLAGARRKGASAVVFTGGEPTLHPDILDMVSRARRLGYERIQLQTNGRTFAYRGLLEALRDAGATEFGPSLHGAKAATHDGLTRSPGSFAQTVAGMKNASALGLQLVTNSVITRANYRELPALARLLVGLGVTQYQFAFVHIVGTALEKKESVVPRKTDVMPYVRKGLDAGLRAGVACYTEAIPYCLMKGYERCVAESIIPEGPIADGDLYIDNYADYRRAEGKAKAPSCRPCRYFKVCEGPWREYPEMYGWDEFKPVPKAARRRA